MKAMNDTKPTLENSPPKSVATNRNAKRALATASEYVSRVLAASALTMWGALNLIVSIRNAFVTPAIAEGVEAPGRSWITASGHSWITWCFVAVTALLPFLIGLHLFRKLYQQTKVQ